MKTELDNLQKKFVDAGTLLDDALDILSSRDEMSEKEIDKAVMKLFKLRDKYFLGLSNWDE